MSLTTCDTSTHHTPPNPSYNTYALVMPSPWTQPSDAQPQANAKKQARPHPQQLNNGIKHAGPSSQQIVYFFSAAFDFAFPRIVFILFLRSFRCLREPVEGVAKPWRTNRYLGSNFFA